MIHVIPGPRESLDIEAETVTLDGTAVYQVRQGSSEITATHEQLPELWGALIDLWDAEMRRRGGGRVNKTVSTMTPEQIAQWERDIAAGRLSWGESTKDLNPRITAALQVIAERWPDRVIPWGRTSEIAREFGVRATSLLWAVHREGFRIAPRFEEAIE